MDVSVPSDRNTSTKVIEKISKNEDLEIEITKMWVLKVDTFDRQPYTFLSVPKDQRMGPVLIKLILLILFIVNINSN